MIPNLDSSSNATIEKSIVHFQNLTAMNAKDSTHLKMDAIENNIISSLVLICLCNKINSIYQFWYVAKSRKKMYQTLKLIRSKVVSI